jgi:hypothetical protein
MIPGYVFDPFTGEVVNQPASAKFKLSQFARCERMAYTDYMSHAHKSSYGSSSRDLFMITKLNNNLNICEHYFSKSNFDEIQFKYNADKRLDLIETINTT